MHRLPPVFTRTDTLFPYTSRFRSWVSHPQGLGDPSALIDEDARRLWLGNVREARPIYRQPIQTLIASMSLPFLGLIGFGLAIWENRRNPARPRGWLAVATLAAFSFAFCFFQTRAAPAAQVLGLSGAAKIGRAHV